MVREVVEPKDRALPILELKSPDEEVQRSQRLPAPASAKRHIITRILVYVC